MFGIRRYGHDKPKELGLSETLRETSRRATIEILVSGNA